MGGPPGPSCFVSDDPACALHIFAICYNKRACGDQHLLIGADRLRSACGRPFHTFDGYPITPSVAGRAALILDGINQAHPFQDGNKRTSWMCMIYFLARSGFSLDYESDETAENFVLGLVNHSITTEQATEWIASRLVARP